jgi:hypothetical protein
MAAKLIYKMRLGEKWDVGSGTPQMEKILKKVFVVVIYQRLTQIIVWKPLKDFANSLHFADSYANFSFQHTK